MENKDLNQLQKEYVDITMQIGEKYLHMKKLQKEIDSLELLNDKIQLEAKIMTEEAKYAAAQTELDSVKQTFDKILDKENV